MAIEGQRLMSKTQHYRKITKPLLERKRRARMNLYLDELKDLIVETMEAEGEHVSKLEKADILEMTVTFLKTRKDAFSKDTNIANQAHKTGGVDAEKFRAGYTQAAYEVSKVFASLPGLDLKFGTRLMKHLGYQLKDIKAPDAAGVATTQRTTNSLTSLTYSPEIILQAQPIHQNDVKINDNSRELSYNNELQSNDVWRPW